MSWRRYYKHPIDRQPHSWPYPPGHVFQDISTGTLYLLSHDSGTDTLSLTSTIPPSVTSAPHNPILQSVFGPQRLYVEDGTLKATNGAVAVGPHQAENVVVDAPLWTLETSERRVTYRVYMCTDELGSYGLEKWEGVGNAITITDIGCAVVVTFTDGVFDEGLFE